MMHTSWDAGSVLDRCMRACARAVLCRATVGTHPITPRAPRALRRACAVQTKCENSLKKAPALYFPTKEKDVIEWRSFDRKYVMLGRAHVQHGSLPCVLSARGVARAHILGACQRGRALRMYNKLCSLLPRMPRSARLRVGPLDMPP